VVTRRLGSDGPPISVLGLGTWAMGGPWQFGWGPADDAESVAAIQHAVELGVNWVDTAPLYGHGHAEEVVARALEPFHPGEDVLVFTKCGRRFPAPGKAGPIRYDLSPASIREECEQSLRRLRIERIDLYQIHWPDLGTGTPVEESWQAMAALQDEGQVRWLGVCNFSLELLERIEAVRHVDSLQPSFSLLSRHPLEALIPRCRERGTGVLAYSPMASGLLTGSFGRDGVERLAPDDWRRRSPMFTEPKLSQNLALVERLGRVAERLGCSLPALALAWTLANPGVTAAIAGGRRPSQVDGWIEAADVALSEADLAEIEQAVEGTDAGTTDPPVPPPVEL
jgi:aryl-alcohol dehydrogenase-like predicted oxidoreductase